jgi:predicted outer membrane protein
MFRFAPRDPGHEARMKRMMLSLLIAALALSSAGVARADSSADTAFVQKAQADLLGQYAIAALAKGHTSDPATLSLANEIVQNASASNRFLISYAKSHAIALQNKPDFRTDAQYGVMTSLSGSDFNHKFAQDVYADSQLQDSDFSDAESGASDPTLKSFAKREDSQLQKFGDQAQKLGG